MGNKEERELIIKLMPSVPAITCKGDMNWMKYQMKKFRLMEVLGPYGIGEYIHHIKKLKGYKHEGFTKFTEYLEWIKEDLGLGVLALKEYMITYEVFQDEGIGIVGANWGKLQQPAKYIRARIKEGYDKQNMISFTMNMCREDDTLKVMLRKLKAEFPRLRPISTDKLKNTLKRIKEKTGRKIMIAHAPDKSVTSIIVPYCKNNEVKLAELCNKAFEDD